MSKIVRITQIIGIVLCCMLIVIPPVLTLSGIKIGEGINENRAKAEKPKYNGDSIKYIVALYHYFQDNLFARDLFISVYNNIAYYYIKKSPIPERVLIGKDHYLFYTNKRSGNFMADYQGLIKITDNDLGRLYNNISDFQNWLTQNNIKFYLVTVPEKQSIYYDKLPDTIGRGNATTVDHIVSFLRKNNFPILDLREVLLNYKPYYEELYYKTDTHWNKLGAYFAYQAIVKELKKDFPVIQPVTIEVNNVKYTQYNSSGDLLITMGIKEYPHFRDIECTIPQHYSIVSVSKFDAEIITETPQKNLPKAIIYRDSFFVNVIPFLSNNLRFARYIWKKNPEELDVDKNIILNDKPDFVMIEIGERKLKELHISF